MHPTPLHPPPTTWKCLIHTVLGMPLVGFAVDPLPPVKLLKVELRFVAKPDVPQVISDSPVATLSDPLDSVLVMTLGEDWFPVRTSSS